MFKQDSWTQCNNKIKVRIRPKKRQNKKSCSSQSWNSSSYLDRDLHSHPHSFLRLLLWLWDSRILPLTGHWPAIVYHRPRDPRFSSSINNKKNEQNIFHFYAGHRHKDVNNRNKHRPSVLWWCSEREEHRDLQTQWGVSCCSITALNSKILFCDPPECFPMMTKCSRLTKENHPIFLSRWSQMMVNVLQGYWRRRPLMLARGLKRKNVRFEVVWRKRDAPKNWNGPRMYLEKNWTWAWQKEIKLILFSLNVVDCWLLHVLPVIVHLEFYRLVG